MWYLVIGMEIGFATLAYRIDTERYNSSKESRWEPMRFLIWNDTMPEQDYAVAKWE